tara:strand:+ start:2159 stop:2521 length:363 start_codon:yes stop_codon:yes gene_type:complete
MATAKKTTAKKATAKKRVKRAVKREERREKIRRLGLLIVAATEEAVKVLPNAKPEERRKWVVDELNEKLDIPVLSEDQEEVILGLLVDTVSDVMCKNMNDGHKAILLKNAAGVFSRLRNK